MVADQARSALHNPSLRGHLVWAALAAVCLQLSASGHLPPGITNQHLRPPLLLNVRGSRRRVRAWILEDDSDAYIPSLITFRPCSTMLLGTCI